MTRFDRVHPLAGDTIFPGLGASSASQEGVTAFPQVLAAGLAPRRIQGNTLFSAADATFTTGGELAVDGGFALVFG